MSGTIIKSARNTANAPQDLSPSTQSVAFSHYNNISAQLPVDPKTGALVAGDIKAQARQCLTNIKAIVESIDHVMDDVVKITVFLKEIADLDAVNAVYREFFPRLLPTRTVLAVAGLPLGAAVQMDALISNGEGTFPQAPCPLLKLSATATRRRRIRSRPIPSPSPTTTISVPSCRSMPHRASWSPVASSSRRSSACATSSTCWRASMCRLTISSRSPSI